MAEDGGPPSPLLPTTLPLRAHIQCMVILTPGTTPAAQLVTAGLWVVMQVPPLGGQRRGPELTLLCPACLSRSLSACLSSLGPSSAGETRQLGDQGLSGLRLGLTSGAFCLCPCLTLARGQTGMSHGTCRLGSRSSGLGGRPWEVTWPRSSKGRHVPLRLHSPDDFRGTWAPLKTTVVLTGRKLVPF